LKETYRWYTRHHEEARKVSFTFEDKLIRQAKEIAKAAESRSF